jgi:23S rRNA (pseudouridine1915-N3)-methyltransferase
MRVVIAAVGRLKDGPERVLFEKYRARFEAQGQRLGLSPVSWLEIAESPAATPERRKHEEAAGLGKLTRQAEAMIALDRGGRSITSDGVARLLAKLRDDGTKVAAFAIGGPDGLSRELLATARHTLAFGAITLPHQLARIILVEQLYRASTILAGHPYHRS